MLHPGLMSELQPDKAISHHMSVYYFNLKAYKQMVYTDSLLLYKLSYQIHLALTKVSYKLTYLNILGISFFWGANTQLAAVISHWYPRGAKI